MIYLADIIMFSKNIDDQLKYIEEVLKLLPQAGMTLRLNKWFFMHKRIEYIGHIVEPGELYVANQVIKARKEMEPPGKKTQLRSLLGMWNVYRKLLKDFATITAPIDKLLKKTVSVSIETVTKDQQQSFETVKQKLAYPPILALPRADLPDLPYILD